MEFVVGRLQSVSFQFEQFFGKQISWFDSDFQSIFFLFRSSVIRGHEIEARFIKMSTLLLFSFFGSFFRNVF